MAGQFKTRRGAGGRLEKIPEAEQGALRAAAEGIKPAPEAEDPFIKAFRESEGEGGPEPEALPAGHTVNTPPGPPPLPTRPHQPPPLPEASTAEDTIAGATKGASVGARFGPVGAAAGAVVGGAASLLYSHAKTTKPIGTLEGPTTQGGDTSMADLRELLEVTKKVAAVGTPIKNAVTTTAVGSRV